MEVKDLELRLTSVCFTKASNLYAAFSQVNSVRNKADAMPYFNCLHLSFIAKGNDDDKKVYEKTYILDISKVQNLGNFILILSKFS